MPRSEVFDREIVLAKVRDLFWDKGFNGTSMNGLVAATGLNRSSLYNSFGNKMTLYKTVLIQYQEESQLIFKSALLRATNPLEAIQFVFDNFVEEIVKDTQGKGCFNINCKVELSRSNAPIKEYLEKMQESNLEFFKGLVQEGQDARLINTLQISEHYAYYLFSAFQGLRVTGILMRNRNMLEQIVSNTLKVLK